MYCSRYKILWLFLHDLLLSLSIKNELKHSSIVAQGGLYFSLGYLWIVLHVTNSITHYQQKKKKKKSWVEVKFNHCLRQILNIKSHSVWTGDFCLRWNVDFYPPPRLDCRLNSELQSGKLDLCKLSQLLWICRFLKMACSGLLWWCIVDFTYFLTVSWWVCWDRATAVKYWWRDT